MPKHVILFMTSHNLCYKTRVMTLMNISHGDLHHLRNFNEILFSFCWFVFPARL